MNLPAPRILLTAFVGDLSMHVAMGSFSYRAQELGASAGQIGFVGGVIDFVYFVVALTLPRVTDGKSRRNITRIAAVTMAAGAALAWQAASLPAFVLALSVLRAGSALFWPTVEARLSDEHFDDLGRAVSAFSLSWSCGKALGYAINALGFGEGLYGPRDSFLITVTGALLLVLCAPRDHARSDDVTAGVAAPGSRWRIWAAWIGVFVGCGAFIVLQNQNAPIMAAKGQTPSFGNLMLAALVFTQMFMFEVLRRAPALAGSARALGGSIVVLLVGTVALLSGSDRLTLSLGAAILGAGLGLVYTQSLFLSLRLPHKKSVAAGIHEAFIGIANASLAPIAGMATERWGNGNGALVFAVILMAAGGALVAFCLARARGAGAART